MQSREMLQNTLIIEDPFKSVSIHNYNTVEPVLSGQPRGMAKWPLNTG